jgi:hypothetical protein
MDLRSLTRAKENKGYTAVSLMRDEDGRYAAWRRFIPTSSTT